MGTIAEKLTYLEGTKSAIKDAIIAKGVEVTDTDTFRSYAEKIESIEAGGSCESQSKELTITDNGIRVVTPDEGYLLDQVTVTTNVIAGKPELPNGISFDGSTWTTFDTDPYDWSQIYSGTKLFSTCTKLKTLTGTAIENVYFLDLYNTFSSCLSLTDIPVLAGKPRTLEYCFYYCQALNKPDFSRFDFSDVVSIRNAFYLCKEWAQEVDLSNAPIRDAGGAFKGSAITTLPLLNYSVIENCDEMFFQSRITTATIDLPNLVTARSMFYNANSLVELNITGMQFNENLTEFARACHSLTKVSAINSGSVSNLQISSVFFQCENLTDFGGLINIGESFTAKATVSFSTNTRLTRESALNIINGLYDFIGNGSTITSTLDFSNETMLLLNDEDIAIAIAKG